MYVFLILLVILGLALFIPIGTLVLVENTNIIIKLVFFRVIKIKVFDKTKVKKSKKAVRKLRTKIPLEILLEIARKILPHIKRLMLKMNIRTDMELEYGLSSPDKTALLYGALNALIHSIDNVLKYETKKYLGRYKIEPDLNNQLLNIKFNLEVYTQLIHLIIFTFHALKILIKYKSYFKKEGGALNDRSCNRRTYENHNG
jgi:hypothetical protein